MVLVYIISIVMAVVYGATTFYLEGKIMGMLWMNFTSFFEWNLYGALISETFNLFFILVFCFTLKHIKTTTALVLSIIGISLTGLLFLFNLIPLFDSYAFFHLAYFIYCMVPVLLAFSIVNLVQANIYNRKKNARVMLSTVDDLV